MDYGLLVKYKELKILDEHRINYYYDNPSDLLTSNNLSNNDKIEINFDTEKQRDDALRLLKKHRVKG